MTWQMAMGISRTNASGDLSEQSAAGSCVNIKYPSVTSSLNSNLCLPASSCQLLVPLFPFSDLFHLLISHLQRT